MINHEAFYQQAYFYFIHLSNRLTSRSSIGGNTRRETLTFVARRVAEQMGVTVEDAEIFI